MFARALLLIVILAPTSPLWGQADVDGPIKMTPEFALTFPVIENGKDVTVKYPILINPTTVLKPGMVLRVIYLLKDSNSDGSSNLALAHHGSMEEAYSRPAADDSSQPDKIPAALAHELEGYRRTVWQVTQNFVMAIAQYPTDAMHLIYSPTGKNQDLADERFSFFEGLFVGLPDGKVTVLAVEDDSKAHAANIKAGDEIVAVDGVSPQNDLSTFATIWANAKRNAKYNNAPSFPVTIRAAGASETHTTNVAMPPSIKSSLLDGI